MRFFDPRDDGRTSDSTVEDVAIKQHPTKKKDAFLCCASHTLIFVGPKNCSFDSTWWGVSSFGVAKVFFGTTGRKKGALDLEDSTIERKVIIAFPGDFITIVSHFTGICLHQTGLFVDASSKTRHFFPHPQP